MVNDEEKEFSRLENFLLDGWNKDLAVGLTGAFLCVKKVNKVLYKQSKSEYYSYQAKAITQWHLSERFHEN